MRASHQRMLVLFPIIIARSYIPPTQAAIVGMFVGHYGPYCRENQEAQVGWYPGIAKERNVMDPPHRVDFRPVFSNIHSLHMGFQFSREEHGMELHPKPIPTNPTMASSFHSASSLREHLLSLS